MKSQKKINIFLIVWFVLISILFSIQCKDSNLYLNVDFSFDDIEDIFPKSFNNQNVTLVKDGPNYNKDLNFKNYRIGLYSSDVSLEIWENESENLSKQNWEKMKVFQKKKKMNNYSQEKSSEYRYNFETQDGFTGIIWTNKMFLFRIEAKNSQLMKNFLKNSKIAKIK